MEMNRQGCGIKVVLRKAVLIGEDTSLLRIWGVHGRSSGGDFVGRCFSGFGFRSEGAFRSQTVITMDLRSSTSF